MRTARVRWESLTASTSARKSSASPTPRSAARSRNARMSLGRHPPPKPTPARRKRRPILSSRPIASARSVTSAPAASQTWDTALMKLILVARKAFAATLMSSAVAKSMIRRGHADSIGA